MILDKEQSLSQGRSKAETGGHSQNSEGHSLAEKNHNDLKRRKEKEYPGENYTEVHSIVSSFGGVLKLLFYIMFSSATSTKNHCLLEIVKQVKLGN